MPRPHSSRGYGEYAPLRAGRHRGSWLRTAQLNVRGWSALLGLCTLARLAGVLLARARGLPNALGLALAVLPIAAVLVADRRRWARMETSYGWGASVAEVTRIAEEPRARGVAAQVRPALDHEQPRWDRLEPPQEATASLVYANRHDRAVREVLRTHGVDLPRRGL